MSKPDTHEQPNLASKADQVLQDEQTQNAIIFVLCRNGSLATFETPLNAQTAQVLIIQILLQILRLAAAHDMDDLYTAMQRNLSDYLNEDMEG